jgi:hypothetical protein
LLTPFLLLRSRVDATMSMKPDQNIMDMDKTVRQIENLEGYTMTYRRIEGKAREVVGKSESKKGWWCAAVTF